MKTEGLSFMSDTGIGPSYTFEFGGFMAVYFDSFITVNKGFPRKSYYVPYIWRGYRILLR